MSDKANPYTPERQGADALRDTARDLRDTAASAAERTKEEGAGLLDAARERAAGAAEEGRRAGAEQAQGIARAVHRAAEELQQDSPTVARMMHDAAGSLDGMARALREQSPGEMLHGAEAWARRQPYVFFGVAALAGFALARFARSSAERTPAYGQGYGEQRWRGGMAGTPGAGQGVAGATPAPGWVAGDDGTPRPATMAAASLGGAAAPRPTTGGTG